MKFFKRVIDLRFRRDCTISESHYGFQPGLDTMDAIFSPRNLMKAYRDIKRVLHVPFLDLEKAFDECLVSVSGGHCDPKGSVRPILRSKTCIMFWIAVGHTKPFQITQGFTRTRFLVRFYSI